MPEKQEVTQEDIDKIVAKHAIEGMTNEPVFQYQQTATAKALNLGYPMTMYHARLDPKFIMNKNQKAALEEQGYQAERYIFRSFPAFYFRRNLLERFAEPNPAKGEPGEYIEMRKFLTQQQFDEEQAKRRPRSVAGPWVKTLAELPELPEQPNEDPQVTIARLQGELVARRSAPQPSGEEPVKRGPGRPKKEELVEA